MSDSQDKERKAKPTESPPDDLRPERRSGRVAFDSRNNPIWEWQLETGVYSRDVTTQKLKKLDLGDLSIAESAIQKRPPGLGEAIAEGVGVKPVTPKPLPGGGFNPYDNSVRPPATPDPYNAARALGNKVNTEAGPKSAVSPRPPLARRPVAPVPAPKPSALGKIGQWFKGKRKADDDYE